MSFTKTLALAPAAIVRGAPEASYTAPNTPVGELAARSASTRPIPNAGSVPGMPRSSAVARSRSASAWAVNDGSWLSVRAATPATNGEACEVPLRIP